MSELIVTRHPALVELLQEWGIIEGEPKVIAHATPEEVAGRHVIGVLPLRLAALAASITEVSLSLPVEMRGRELTLEELRQYAGEPRTYTVREVPR